MQSNKTANNELLWRKMTRSPCSFFHFFHCSANAFDMCLLNYLFTYLLTYNHTRRKYNWLGHRLRRNDDGIGKQVDTAIPQRKSKIKEQLERRPGERYVDRRIEVQMEEWWWQCQTNTTIQWTPRGCRGRGRPKNSWKRDLEKDMDRWFEVQLEEDGGSGTRDKWSVANVPPALTHSENELWPMFNLHWHTLRTNCGQCSTCTDTLW